MFSHAVSRRSASHPPRGSVPDAKPDASGVNSSLTFGARTARWNEAREAAGPAICQSMPSLSEVTGPADE